MTEMIKTVSAVEKGSRHAGEGMPCQDRTEAVRTDDLAVIALSDGAGSCPLSHEAAERITKWLPEYLQDSFDDMYLRMQEGYDIAEDFLADAARMLEDSGLIPEESYCTMLFFALHTDGRWICGHIGDGVIFLCQEGESRILSFPENGEYANITFFVNEPPDIARKHMRFQSGIWDRPGSVLMSSDGCQISLYSYMEREPAPIVGILCGWLEKYSEADVELALHRNMIEKFSAGTEDDMSLAMLYAPALGYGGLDDGFYPDHGNEPEAGLAVSDDAFWRGGVL